MINLATQPLIVSLKPLMQLVQVEVEIGHFAQCGEQG